MGKALLAAAAAPGMLVVFVVGAVFYVSWSACLGGERDALTGFPHYADPQIGPRPSTQLTCEVRYTTKAGRKEVLVYYDEHLRKDGWKPVEPPYSPYRAAHPYERGAHGEYRRLSDALATPKSWGGGLTAHRDNYTYDVEYWPPGKGLADYPDDKATVTAYVVERQ